MFLSCHCRIDNVDASLLFVIIILAPTLADRSTVRINSRHRISINDGRCKLTDIASLVFEAPQQRCSCLLEQQSVDFVSASSMYIFVLEMRIDPVHCIEVNDRCFKLRDIASFVSVMLQHRISFLIKNNNRMISDNLRKRQCTSSSTLST